MARALEGIDARLRISRNALARFGARVGAKVLSLALLSLVTRHEGPAALGRYVLITTVVGLALALSDLGLTMLLTREVARTGPANDRQLLLGRLLPLRMATAALAAGVMTGMSWWPLFPEGIARLLPLAALSLLAKAALEILGGFVNGRQRMDVTSAIEVVARLLTLAGAVPILASGFGVSGVLAVTALADAVGAVIYGAVLVSWRSAPHLRLIPSEWPATLAAAYPFALTGIIAIAYRRLDIVMLSAWRGDLAAGRYGAAYKLWEAVGLAPASLLDAMFPEMARLSGDREGHLRLRRMVRRAGPLLLTAGFGLAAACWALAGTLMHLIYGHAQAEGPAVAAFRLLVWAIPAMFVYLLHGHTLYALDRQRWVTAAMAVVGITNVGLNVLAIRRWGTLGVSAVALFSAWLLSALLVAMSRKAMRLRREGP